MEKVIKDILLGTIAGDTLGAPFDGLGEGHINSVFKNINGYTDNFPAIKGKPDRWKKPGLYTSNSQLLLYLSAILSGEKVCSRQKMEALFTEIQETGDTLTGHLRHPSRTVVQAFRRLENPAEVTSSADTSGDVLPLVPALLCLDHAGEEAFMSSITSFISFFSHNPWVLATCMVAINFYAHGWKILPSRDKDGIAEDMLLASKKALEDAEKYSHVIFDSGWNPSTVNEHIRFVHDLLVRVKGAGNLEQAKGYIISLINHHQKTPVTRPTVNHAVSTLTWPCVYAMYNDNPGEYLFNLVQSGGSTGTFMPVAGALFGVYNGKEQIPRVLIDELVNRKRILSMVDTIAGLSVPANELTEFLQNESSLTRKEEEERGSRFKRVPEKKPRKKPKKDRVDELSRHVVESWTKYDKAKWKKQQKKLDSG